MRIKKIVASLISLGMVASPAAFATNGYLPIGYGAQTEGMGGAGIALPKDAIAAANNPAGMVMVGDRADVGLIWFKPSRSAEIVGNGAGMTGTYDGNGKSNFFIPSFGYNKMISSDSSVGVSVFGNGGMNTQYNTNPFASLGGVGPAGINLSQLFIAPTWSMKINSTNAVGVSLNLAYQMFSATGLQAFDNAGFSSNPGHVTNNGTDTSTGYGFRFGWTGEVTPVLTLGATYQTKTKMGKFAKYSGLFADQGSFDIPSTYGVGAAFKAMPATTVALDVTRINYSGVPSVGNSFTSLPPAYGGTGPQLGATNGVGFGWQDMTVIKLGVSYDLDSKTTLRVGYDHNNQQVPTSQTLLNILAPGVVQNHLSLGGTWKLADKSEVTVAYVHAFKQTVNGAGSIPTALGGGNANISMYEDSLSVSYGW
ncbi:OmpP1/FadL family transporter [Sideroxydans lithotrophicus]|uniref:Membrane protein involved in aromatic hydrocarbon degradation n=1 Tax=Sideroxydans lithotrophicus (strain ES-1) TaxID=580332 RepID=D5CSK2_SIDLE|nr:outer membrane protein transport protein [Sideroxydans lithotrophicus]ADE11938.1 membrane protein involved in aromatic hydrocarbon degradation [Sideroxydans lithotrophicus ES-1]